MIISVVCQMSVRLCWFFFFLDYVSYLLRHRLDDNKMGCIEVGYEGLDLISLAMARDT
jgi:hypothetical protein